MGVFSVVVCAVRFCRFKSISLRLYGWLCRAYVQHLHSSSNGCFSEKFGPPTFNETRHMGKDPGKMAASRERPFLICMKLAKMFFMDSTFF